MRNYKWPNYRPRDLSPVFRPWTPLSQELLLSMLRFEPSLRITCENALIHDYIVTGTLVGYPNTDGKYTMQENEQLVCRDLTRQVHEADYS